MPQQDLTQLYRFCFLMMGDTSKAQDVFQTTMHEATLRAGKGEPAGDALWLFRDARFRCLAASESGLQAETVEMEKHSIASWAPSQIDKLEPAQLAIWVSGAPEPQRSALALFFLDHFDHEEMLTLTELKTAEFARLIGDGRRQFQAWLNASFPREET